MISQDNLKKWFLYIIIVCLIIALFLMRMCSPSPAVAGGETITITKTDTVYKEIVKVEEKKVYIDKIVYKTPPGLQYIPSDNCDTLRQRFNAVLKEHTARKTYKDTIKLETYGTIVVTDTVWLNSLLKRKYDFNYKIPTITKEVTVIKPAENKRQLYVGGNMLVSREQLNSFTPGLLYKTKKDQIYQANVGLDFNGQLLFGGGMYFKIKLK